MNTISRADFTRLNNEDAKSIMPVTLLYDGEPYAVVCKLEDVIFLGDLHPRVRIQFKAKEAVIRRGMAKKEEENKRIYLDDFKKA